MTKKIGKVLLAVDLKSDDLKLTQRVSEALGDLVKGAPLVVEPVTILNREVAALGKALRQQIGDIEKAAENHLESRLSKLKIRDLSHSKVLFADGSSTQKAVDSLLQYARKTGCDLIALTSHARKGVKRFFLGSFAETLALQSPVPLLIVSPNYRPTKAKQPTFLFPTDWSEDSKLGLRSICKALSDQKMKVILFHSYLEPMQASMGPFGTLPLPKSLLDEQWRKTQQVSAEWKAELEGRGIACEVVIEKREPYITQGVLAAAKKKKATAIAMASTSGRVETVMLGSVTRQILRESPLPVWIVHPLLGESK